MFLINYVFHIDRLHKDKMHDLRKHNFQIDGTIKHTKIYINLWRYPNPIG